MNDLSVMSKLPIGSKFEYYGLTLEVQSGDTCQGCMFDEDGDRKVCDSWVCSRSCREDNTSVIFVKVKDKPKKAKNVLIDVSDGCTTKAEVHNSGNITVSSVYGYSDNVDILCTLVDNGNGYHVTSKSYSSVVPDHIFNLDYAEIEYIYLAYKALKKSKKEKK